MTDRVRQTDLVTIAQCDQEGTLRDCLLMGVSCTPRVQELLHWAQDTPGLHEFATDYHRLQVERWVWDNRERLGQRVMDIGVITPRRWLGDGYFTLGESGCDVTGDIQALTLPSDSVDGIVCTEVLEHVPDPFAAVAELHCVLKPGGLLLVTSPFAWPWHGTEDYHDYWRFTHQGWRLLLRHFSEVKIKACVWTEEGLALLDIARRFEGWGMRNETRFHTGYLCEAVK